MVTVQLRDESNPERFLIDHIVLPFEPRIGVPMRVWDRFENPGKTSFFGSKKRKVRVFVATEVHSYDISIDEPSQSGIVYLGREIKD